MTRPIAFLLKRRQGTQQPASNAEGQTELYGGGEILYSEYEAEPGIVKEYKVYHENGKRVRAYLPRMNSTQQN